MSGSRSTQPAQPQKSPTLAQRLNPRSISLLRLLTVLLVHERTRRACTQIMNLLALLCYLALGYATHTWYQDEQAAADKKPTNAPAQAV